MLKDNLNRLSIDVDVICPPDTYILQYLNDLEKHGFLRAIPVRTEHAGKKLPASHSKVFYEVAFSNPNSNDAFIRLDVLYEDNPYTHTIAVPIDNLPRKIQKLRKSRPEAFYYWSKVAEMTELK